MTSPTTPSQPSSIAGRRRAGTDRCDEVWAGAYKMVPEPTFTHNAFVFFLQRHLHETWAKPAQGRVARRIVAMPGGWPDRDDRIPDLLLWRAALDHRNRQTHFEGAPDAVIEARSPGGDTYAKLDFYAALGVPEVWVIHRDSKLPELFEPSAETCSQVAPAADGWLCGGTTGLELRAGDPGKLLVRTAADRDVVRQLPED